MRRLGFVLRPYFWLELPGWGRLYRRVVGDFRSDPQWGDGGVRPVRGKLHGFWMEADLSRWSERFTWFVGRFYDLALQRLLLRVLGPGDTCCDVGANIGMLSLVAAARVGASGQVLAFEPNPECARRIEGVKERNGGIPQLRVEPCGLSDAAGPRTLSIPKHNSGEASLTDLRGEIDPGEIERVEVAVRVGDEVLEHRTRRIRLLKIDVEGFEIHVLEGLRGTIGTDRPIIVVEAVPQHLARAGHSVEDFRARLEPLGYSPFRLETRRRVLRHRLFLPPWTAASAANNIVWIHHGDPLREALLGA